LISVCFEIVSVGKKQLFYLLVHWHFAVGKNKCAVCAVGFLVQMFSFSTISALCTTVLYNESGDCG